MKTQNLLSLLLLLTACNRYHPSQGTFEHHPPLVAAVQTQAPQAGGTSVPASGPVIATEVASAPRVPPQTTGESTAEEERMTPMLWGEAATQAVGRSFDPIFFDFDSAELRFAARRTLKDYADWLAQNLGVWIVLEGHCDSAGSEEYNYNLGMARAWAVKSYLVGLGVGDWRLFTISYGEDRPATEEIAPEPEELEKQRAQNRRVQFLAFIAPPGQKVAPQEAPASPAPDLKSPPPALEGQEVP
jgi:peptidoglycan-associated lipoprotein